MLQLYPLVLLVVVQVLGQDIENGVLECDGDWCLVKCNYGYVPTGNYFVPTDQTAGRLTLYTFTSQWAVYFVNANWFFVKFATNNNRSTRIHNTLLVFKFGYCQFCFTIENESSNWCTWQIKYSNVIV